jgi:hypothetical protein
MGTVISALMPTGSWEEDAVVRMRKDTHGFGHELKVTVR